MNKKLPTLLFFGNERLASGVTESGVILSSLIEAGYPIAYVCVNQAARTSRKKQADKVLEIARQHNIPVLTHWDQQAITDIITEHSITHAVLAAYGVIIPQAILDLIEIINVHPSLLPRYRGSTPIESAILDADWNHDINLTGVSIMKLVAKMDAGGVYAQSSLQLSKAMSKQDAYEQLSTLGAKLLLESLPQIIDGSAHIDEQSELEWQVSYSPTLTKQTGQIDWTQCAEDIRSQVVAYLDWPTSYDETVFGKRIIIRDVEVLDVKGTAGTASNIDGRLVVHCGHKSLIIKQLTPAGKKQMTGQSFMAGHPIS